MKHNIIKTENYLLVVDDSEIKEGDWFYIERWANCNRVSNLSNNIISFITNGGGLIGINNVKKNIAHLPLNNSHILEGVPLLTPLEDEIIGKPLDNYIRERHNQDECVGFIDGYNKSKEKYKYTEEDLRKCWKACLDFNKPAGSDSGINLEDFIQSLQQPKYPIGFECEIEVYMHSINGDIVKPKTTTNSNGQTVWVGKYLF